MNLHMSRVGALGLVAFVLVSATMFVLLSARIGGPGLDGSPGYLLRARFADAEGLTQGSDVLVRGLKVGEVSRAATRGAATEVTMALDSSSLPIRGDASVRIGEKTPLGEVFADLSLGRAGVGPRSGSSIPARSSVEIDEALGLLDSDGRRSLVSLVRSLGQGAAAPATPAGVGSTIDGLAGTVDSLHSLSRALRGQERSIAEAVDSSRTVLGELGRHSSAVRGIVRDGRVALSAVAASRAPLRATLALLPAVLAEARGTLAEARPLVIAAQPVAAVLREAAPPLTTALESLPPVLRSARALVALGPGLERVARPALIAARALLPLAAPAARLLGPALANAVPMVRFLAPRANTAAAWFANTADLGSNGDAKGKWARFFIFSDPATASGASASPPPGNTYTKPGDAAHNEPYRPGDYPRLMPYGPAFSGATGSRSDGP